MNSPTKDGGGGGRDERASPAPPPSVSSRVRLEVDFLDGDRVAPAPAPSATNDERARRTVLVVAGESDVRRYVRECLRERSDLRLVEAATASAAIALVADEEPELLIVDEPERDVVAALSHLRAIVIVADARGGDAPPDAHVRLLGSPFAAGDLASEVQRALD